MYKINDSFEERKTDLILRLYVDLADQDYLSARHAYHNGLFHIFYWCSAQASEKYMKAFILLQNKSAQDQRHNLVDLFGIVRTLDIEQIVPKLLICRKHQRLVALLGKINQQSYLLIIWQNLDLHTIDMGLMEHL